MHKKLRTSSSKCEEAQAALARSEDLIKVWSEHDLLAQVCLPVQHFETDNARTVAGTATSPENGSALSDSNAVQTFTERAETAEDRAKAVTSEKQQLRQQLEAEQAERRKAAAEADRLQVALLSSMLRSSACLWYHAELPVHRLSFWECSIMRLVKYACEAARLTLSQLDTDGAAVQGQLGIAATDLRAAKERAMDAEQALSLTKSAHRGCGAKLRRQHEHRQQAHQHRLEQLEARRKQAEAEQQQAAAALAAEHSAWEQDEHWQAGMLRDITAGQDESSGAEVSGRQTEQPDVTMPMQVAGTQLPHGAVSAPAHSSAGAGRPAMLETQLYANAMDLQQSQQGEDGAASEHSSPAEDLSNSSSKENRAAQDGQTSAVKLRESQVHSSLQGSGTVAAS